MFAQIKKIFHLFNPDERRYALLVMGMILVMAFLDVMGVASIMPFMAVLADAQLVENNIFLASIYSRLGFNDTHNFLIFLGLMVFLMLVTSLTFKALATYTQLRFILMREYSIGRRLIEGYLHQPYAWFLNRHSAVLGKTVLSEVNIVISGAIMPMMTMISQGVVVCALLIFLLFVNTKLAVVTGLVLGVAYSLIFKVIRKVLLRIGQERVTANQDRFMVVNEAFNAIKEVKVGGLESMYVDRFSQPSETYARHQSTIQILAQVPRFALEMVAFGGMLLVMIYLMIGSVNGLASALPIIALYAFAGYRLMPAVQQIYSSITQLQSTGPALSALYSDLNSIESTKSFDVSDTSMQLLHAITLSNVNFSYLNAQQAAVHNLNLNIPAYSMVGFVGHTGSGKSTIINLILGLLKPEQGCLKVDGVSIDARNSRQWQRIIGYVPQHIYLSDDTVAANIAFGVKPSEIDQDAVERAARIANVHEFVVEEMQNGYATKIGERGVCLSGGQCQRIGIARALYHNPQVLILDEATSALDNQTERYIMNNICKLSQRMTVILIAHRLATVRDCDQIYLLDHGHIKAHGTYNELVKTNQTFQAMIG